MTPSLFSCASGDQVSEVDIAHGWGSSVGARAALEQHWDTFINETDFQYMASIGINTVRLPIGYWNLGPDFVQDTPYADVGDVYQNSWQRIVRTINTAAANGIGVLVDLHGAPGSQNGQQHSGISDGQTNLFDSPAFINQTMAVLTHLMQQLAYVTNVVGIQILNEPENVPSLTDFYDQAISAMRQVYPNANMPLYLHDGFDLDRFNNYVANRKDFVVQDHHSYFVFTPADSSEPASQHTSDIQNGIGGSLREASLQSEDDPDQARMDFCTGQIEVYANNTAGWSFWAYRKEDCIDDPGWCFGAAVGKALPSTFFPYGAPPAVPEPSQLPDMSTLSQGMTPPSDQADPSSTTSSSQYEGYAQSEPPAAPPAFQSGPGYPQDPSTDNGPPSASQQASRVKGYEDGFLTARIFALYNLSKLGFVGQYILDSLAALGPGVIAPGTESFYEEGFTQGLADGEGVVSAGLDASRQR
ncbi:glycoside hydrolase family 5 protein [Phanerochaete sordida]|uniref:Glycoside hydrolase family 5 protein n=1 Tax=Phanerochaete sordida TaxID=48140 RepID=A0A9P3LII7_9APHY|nr:glycoside hydrolase family 5 protein [Phanerochaete sordida]